jgi:hypothetical protein
MGNFFTDYVYTYLNKLANLEMLCWTSVLRQETDKRNGSLIRRTHTMHILIVISLLFKVLCFDILNSVAITRHIYRIHVVAICTVWEIREHV